MHIVHTTRPVVFIADLHLSHQRPDMTNAFFDFLDQQQDIDALYIMGDLFEFWTGDDMACPFAQQVAIQLKQASQRFSIYYTTGNRDFLIGPDYLIAAGMMLLPDVHLINLFNTKTLVMHGDLLCTDDIQYQKFRRWSRQPYIQRLFLALPKWIRRFVANQLRRTSANYARHKTDSTMDAVPTTVQQLLQKHQAMRIVHGHTHRPYLHQLLHNQERWVVGDWYEQSSILRVSSQGHELRATPLHAQPKAIPTSTQAHQSGSKNKDPVQ
jgi:UDP-2,3-diacylglucosamine hydrolase